MNKHNTKLALLVVQEYAKILYRYYREKKASASEITTALARYMKALGLPTQVYLLAFFAFCALC